MARFVGRVSLQAGGAANYSAVYDQVNNRDDTTKTRSFFGIQYSKSRSSSSSIENTPWSPESKAKPNW